MEEQQQQHREKYTVIGVKVSPFARERITRICRKRRLSPYKMLQMMCDCVIRYMDDRHNLTEEMERVMSIFEHMTGWKDAFNLADPTTDREVAEAFYVLQDPSGKNKGVRCVWVRKPWMGRWEQNENIQQILEHMIEVLSPERYWKLRNMASDMDCSSVWELIDLLIDAHTLEQVNADLRKDFEDCNRADNAKPYGYGQRTVRKHHFTPDTMRQATIRFTDDDREAAAGDTCNDMEEYMGFRPFGGEW